VRIKTPEQREVGRNQRVPCAGLHGGTRWTGLDLLRFRPINIFRCAYCSDRTISPDVLWENR
jgi:hypothetical protein